MQNNKFKHLLFNLGKILLILWGIAWALGNFASIAFSYQDLVNESSQILDTNSSVISTTAFDDRNLNSVEQIFKASFKPFLILSTISVILAILILYNGRSFLEMIYTFNFFIIPRQRKYWGLIKDSKSGTKVTLASISLLQIRDGKEIIVFSTVSDLDGHYRVRLTDFKSKFFIVVKAEGYQAYKKEIESSVKSIVKGGEYVEDIYLTRTNELVKVSNKWSSIKSRLYTPLIIYLLLLSIFGFLLYINQFIIKPGIDSFLGAIMFALAVTWNIYIITERSRLPMGKILDEHDSPIIGVSVKLFYNDKQLGTWLSDWNGVIKLEVGEGNYKLLVTKEGFKLIDSEDGFVEGKVNKDGYLDKNIVMQKVGASGDNSKLTNPF